MEGAASILEKGRGILQEPWDRWKLSRGFLRDLRAGCWFPHMLELELICGWVRAVE